MPPSKQRTSEICRECGGTLAITPTASPWNFDAVCPCGRWLIAWATREAPPRLLGAPPQQLLLFP